MRTLIIMLALASTMAHAEDAIYTTAVPKAITKLEAMKVLLTSDNKSPVYKCQLQELLD